jgi:DNA-binding LytR/AlgR family response regulator
MEENTILLVEDDFLNRRFSRKILREHGYQVLEAKNAGEAIEILKKEKIGLAILDINLGDHEQDGISIGQELREKYAIPFIYLTAYDNSEIVKKAIATTPHAYLTKPFKNTDILTSVELALHRFSSQQKRKPTVFVRDGTFNIALPTEDICYIEAERNYLLFYTKDKVYKNRCTIRQILNILPANSFIQTHRAFVVNKNKIVKFNIKNLMINNVIIPISKNYIDNFSQKSIKQAEVL